MPSVPVEDYLNLNNNNKINKFLNDDNNNSESSILFKPSFNGKGNGILLSENFKNR